MRQFLKNKCITFLTAKRVEEDSYRSHASSGSLKDSSYQLLSLIPIFAFFHPQKSLTPRKRGETLLPEEREEGMLPCEPRASSVRMSKQKA
jgi:hypothetical protein